MGKKRKEAVATFSKEEKQLAFLLKLSDAIRPLDNPVDIEEAVTKIALDFMDADRCYYCTIEEGNVIILRDASRGNLPSIAGVYPISSYPMFKGVLDAGHPFIVEDVHTTDIIDEELKQLCLQLELISFINVPVIKNGKCVGVLSLLQTKPRKWTDAEMQLTIETAERTWSAVERAKGEEALRKSEGKYRSLFNSIDSGFCIIEVLFDENEIPYDYRFLEANNAFEKQTGLIDGVGKTMKEMVHGHEQYWFDIYGRIAKTGKSERFEHEAKALGIYYEVYAFSVDEPEENRVAILFKDITERKQTEEKIRESEQRFRNLVEQAPVAFCFFRGENFVVEVANEKQLQLTGKTKEEVMNIPAFTSIPETVGQGYQDIVEGVYITGIPFIANESPLTISHNGKEVTTYINFVLEPFYNAEHKIDGVFSVTTDVTEQVLARKVIEESELEIRKIKEQLELSIQAGKIGVWHWDVQKDILFWSNEQKEMFGVEQSENITCAAQFQSFVLPEDWERLLINIQGSNIELDQEYDFRIKRKNDGEIRWLKSKSKVLLDEKGNLKFISGVNIDVSEQMFSLNKIKESEQRYHALFMNSPFAFSIMKGKDMKVTLANDLIKEFWGKGKNVEGKTLLEILPELSNQPFPAMIDSVYTSGEPVYANEMLAQLNRNGIMEDRYFNIVYEPYLEADETISGVITIAHEVTQQVIARKKIEESEKKFEAAILAVNGIIWTNNANGEMVGEQIGWANLTGQNFEEYQGYGWANAVHPDDAQPTVEAWNKAVATNSTFEFEHKVKTKQDGWRLFSIKAVPVLDENGIIQQWVGVHTDITEQKLAEEKLAYRTALLEAHNEASVDGLLLVDAKGEILSFNQRFVEIWNMPRHIVNNKDDEAALSFAMNQLVNPQQFIDKVKYFYDHQTETCLDELEFKDGKVVERNGYAVIGVDGTYYAWSWTFKDITERRRIEQDLKNTQEQLELTFKNIPAGVYLINAKGEMVYVNDRGAAVYGDFTPEYILEHKDLSTLLKIADELFERFDENGNYFSSQNSPAFISLTTGESSQAILKQINKVTREQRWYYVQGAPLFDEKGNVSQVLITSTDITEQKNAEEKIKYSEERFRSLAQTLPQLVWVTDAQGNAEFASPRWKEYSGIEPGGEKEWKDIVHPDDFDNINATWMHCLTTGDIYTFDVRLKNKNGEYRWYRVIGEPVLDNENKIVKWVGAFTDIHSEKLFTQELELKVKERTTELKQFNIELEKKNKELESFAYISSHDLQEPLRKIQILATRIIEKESLSEIGKDNFNRMQLAAKRMQTLIEDLLVYSKANTSERIFETIHLNKIVEEVKDDLSEELKEKNATIETSDLCDVKIIPFQFRQLMHNLIGNALKFSVQNRIPHIQIKSVIAYGRQLNNEKLKSENRYCHITVSDNGIGFEQEYSEKIFEVFQRLHGRNEYIGTGIGLSIVKKIVENHEGIITAHSELNKGATFNIYIPVR